MPSLAIFGVMEVDDTQVQASCVTFCYSFHKGKVEPRLVHLCFCELWLRKLDDKKIKKIICIILNVNRCVYW